MRGISYKTYPLFLTSALLFLLMLPLSTLASSVEDMRTLGMYYEAKDLVVAATRNPKPISQAAENITVITAGDMEMMGAHTLVDVLANVPGIRASDMGGPGLFNEFSIQGANVNHILVMLDGVTLNLLGTPFVDISGFPIRNIERIEIVKGPGSSSWGSALGAVINIVTKSPMDGRYFGGRASFSGGERGTRESRGELSGTVGPFGYYLFGGNLRSGGFRPNSRADQNDIYAKLRWELPDRGSLRFSLAYDRGIAGEGENNDWVFRRYYLLSSLSLDYPLSDNIDLSLNLRSSHKKVHEFSVGDPSDGNEVHEAGNGGSAELIWRSGPNTLAVGFDYDHLKVEDFGFRRISDKYGLFLNDTVTIGDVSVTPGVRYDRMKPVGDFFSPSLGVAWNPAGEITLRAYAARGYSLPLLCPVRNPFPSQQRVTTVQAGVETTLVPLIWLKATFFYNSLSNIQMRDPSNWRNILLKKQLKQGVEVEGKTAPLFNTSLSAGYTFVDSKDRESGETLRGIPRQIVTMGVRYEDAGRSFRGALLGRYSWLNSPDVHNGRYSAVIWDLNLAKRLHIRDSAAVELFFNAHNIFNGAQYFYQGVQNARRWFEGGIRFDF